MNLSHVLSIACLIALTGCDRSEKANTLLQVNDTCMFISRNPIKHDATVIFELKPSEDILKNIEQNLEDNVGPGMFSVQLEDGSSLPLSKVKAKSRKIERSISVKQGVVVLYEYSQTVTRENLRKIAPVVLKSTEWAYPITPGGGALDFKVEYRRYWELEKHGKGMTVIQSNSCQTPVSQANSRKQDKQGD
jgi:hypothetical protein